MTSAGSFMWELYKKGKRTYFNLVTFLKLLRDLCGSIEPIKLQLTCSGFCFENLALNYIPFNFVIRKMEQNLGRKNTNNFRSKVKF